MTIDTINGVFLHQSGGSGPLGKIIRGTILLIISVILILDPKSRKEILVPLFLFFILSSLVLVTITQEIGFLGVHLKFLSITLLTEIVRLQIIRGRLSFKQFETIILINLLVLLFNMVAFLMGYGYEYYGGKAGGGQGFIYAGNEIGVTFVAILILYLWILYVSETSLLKKWSIIILLCLIGFGILNKTAITGLGLMLFYVFFIKNPVRIVGLGLVLSLPYFLFQDFWIDKITSWVGRVSYFIRTYGFEVVIFGGARRLGYLKEIATDFYDNPFLLVIGQGGLYRNENNLADVLVAFGIGGLIFYFIWFFYLANLIKIGIKNNVFGSYKFDLLVFGLLIITYVSVFAGHTLQSNMFALFAALIFNAGYFIKDYSID